MMACWMINHQRGRAAFIRGKCHRQPQFSEPCYNGFPDPRNTVITQTGYCCWYIYICNRMYHTFSQALLMGIVNPFQGYYFTHCFSCCHFITWVYNPFRAGRKLSNFLTTGHLPTLLWLDEDHAYGIRKRFVFSFYRKLMIIDLRNGSGYILLHEKKYMLKWYNEFSK